MALSKIESVGIATGAVGATDIANGAVGATQLASGAVGATQLASTLDLTGKTVTLPTGSSWTVLATGNFDAAGSQTFSTFPSGIKEIWISVWAMSKNVNDTSYTLRLNNQASGYYYHLVSFTASITTEQTRGENATEHRLVHFNNDSQGYNYGDIFIRNSYAAGQWIIRSDTYDLDSSGEGTEFSQGVVTLSSGAVTSVTIYAEGGSFDDGSYVVRYR